MELEKYLIDTTLEVFASMIFIEIAPESSTDTATSAINPNMTSIIGLAGDLKGYLAVHCPESVALGVTAAMLGTEQTEMGEDVKDAIGEIANMIAGGLKIGLAGEGRKIELAIPTTVIGKTFRTGGLSGATSATVSFTSPIGRFSVEFRFIVS